MQDRVDTQHIWRPNSDNGVRILIDGASNISPALPLRKKVNIWASKACWVKIGGAAVTAAQPAGAGDVLTGGESFPLAAGGTYDYTPVGANDRYIAVIEDAAESGTTGYLFIGQAES